MDNPRTELEIMFEEMRSDTRSLTKPKGAKYINDTAVHTGPFQAVTALSDSFIDVSDCDVSFIEGASSDFMIPQGMTIYGEFPTISLDSGEVIVYKL